MEGISVMVAHPRGPNLAVRDSLEVLNQVCGGSCSWCGQEADYTSGIEITNSSKEAFKAAEVEGKPTLKIT